jgi:hypothetical protein
MEQRLLNFVIPSKLYELEFLDFWELALLSRIAYFTYVGELGCCKESNRKLGEMFRKHEDTVRRSLQRMEDHDLIVREQTVFGRELHIGNFFFQEDHFNHLR